MPLPYKISTLLYAFNRQDEVLLLERSQSPNQGRWSPPGGKLKTDLGESPYACAIREAHEEMGLSLARTDLHLTGIVSEHGYEGTTHWLMFLFEINPRLSHTPSDHREGRFNFFPRSRIDQLIIPDTDREKIWPWFWQHRHGFFAAHCHYELSGRYCWTLEESIVPPGPRSEPP